MPRLIKLVAGIEITPEGKAICKRFEKDLTDVFKEERQRMQSNELGITH